DEIAAVVDLADHAVRLEPLIERDRAPRPILGAVVIGGVLQDVAQSVGAEARHDEPGLVGARRDAHRGIDRDHDATEDRPLADARGAPPPPPPPPPRPILAQLRLDLLPPHPRSLLALHDPPTTHPPPIPRPLP